MIDGVIDECKDESKQQLGNHRGKLTDEMAWRFATLTCKHCDSGFPKEVPWETPTGNRRKVLASNPSAGYLTRIPTCVSVVP